MNKVNLQGVSIGTVVALISSLFAYLFHKNMPVAVVSFLPAVVSFVASYFGLHFATARAAKKAAKNNPPAAE